MYQFKIPGICTSSKKTMGSFFHVSFLPRRKQTTDDTTPVFLCKRERDDNYPFQYSCFFTTKPRREDPNSRSICVRACERGLVMAVARSNLVACQIMW